MDSQYNIKQLVEQVHRPYASRFCLFANSVCLVCLYVCMSVIVSDLFCAHINRSGAHMRWKRGRKEDYGIYMTY